MSLKHYLITLLISGYYIDLKKVYLKKVVLIITSAGGSGVKDTVKLIKNNLFYWGVPTIYTYGITTMKMGDNYIDYKSKDKIKSSKKNKKVGIKTKFFFKIFGMAQKKVGIKQILIIGKIKDGLMGRNHIEKLVK